MMQWASVTADQFPRLGVDLPPPDDDADDIAILLRWGARGEGAHLWHHASRVAFSLNRTEREIVERDRLVEVERRQIEAMSPEHARLIARGMRELERIRRGTMKQTTERET